MESMIIPTLRQLQYLVALGETGSFSRAAEACHVTQPTLSAGIKELEDLDLEFDETLEVTFCEIKEDFQIFQPQYDFGSYTIEPGPKCYLNLHEAGEPESGKYYGFAGRIRFEVDGILLRSQPTLKLDLTYVDSFGKYHIFKTPEVITDADDYRGCSGAPILDETGKLVGLVQSVCEGTDRIYAFSIEACINLLDMAIKTNLV